ncbi:MAG: GNAT family N-acetyltransferase [Nocardioidaceae bacterium]
MEDLAGSPHLRPATDDDEQFLFDVFTTTWAEEVAALPNPNLAAHVLRIQHTAQERRFEARYGDYDRFVIVHDGRRAGRFYAQSTPTMVHAIDMTLLPEFRSQGIGSRIVGDLLAMTARNGQSVTLRVPRRNTRAIALYEASGFRLVTVDDLDCYFEWSPSLSAGPGTREPSARDLAR